MFSNLQLTATLNGQSSATDGPAAGQHAEIDANCDLNNNDLNSSLNSPKSKQDDAKQTAHAESGQSPIGLRKRKLSYTSEDSPAKLKVLADGANKSVTDEKKPDSDAKKPDVKKLESNAKKSMCYVENSEGMVYEQYCPRNTVSSRGRVIKLKGARK